MPRSRTRPATPALTFRSVGRWSGLSVALYASALTMAAATFVMPKPAAASDENRIERLATCADSWFEWKDTAPRMTEYVRYLQTGMETHDDGQSYRPKAPTTLLGMPVATVYPQSIGMGVGFSVVVDADVAQVRRAYEQRLGRPLACATSDGMRSCTVELGDKKSVILMADLHAGKPTLAGCFYLYQK